MELQEMPSGHLILHPNQNQAAWAVNFHPVLRGTKAFRDVSYPKMHNTHLAPFSPGRGSCTE